MQEFTTEPSTDRLETVEFHLDGIRLFARKPKSVSFIGLTDTMEMDGVDAIKGTLRFMDEALLPESRDHIQARLDDPDDDFDVDNVVPILNWVIEEFTNRPTGRPSPPPQPRRRTGSRSTALSPSKELTPDNSVSTAS